MGHSPLLSSIFTVSDNKSPVCPHCGGDDETAQHLLLCCPAHAGTDIHQLHQLNRPSTHAVLPEVTPPPAGNERAGCDSAPDYHYSLPGYARSPC